METWPLWMCLKTEQLLTLIDFQWKNHGLKLDLVTDTHKEVENLAEIDRLIRIPTKWVKYPHG